MSKARLCILKWGWGTWTRISWYSWTVLVAFFIQKSSSSNNMPSAHYIHDLGNPQIGIMTLSKHHRWPLLSLRLNFCEFDQLVTWTSSSFWHSHSIALLLFTPQKHNPIKRKQENKCPIPDHGLLTSVTYTVDSHSVSLNNYVSSWCRFPTGLRDIWKHLGHKNQRAYILLGDRVVKVKALCDFLGYSFVPSLADGVQNIATLLNAMACAGPKILPKYMGPCVRIRCYRVIVVRQQAGYKLLGTTLHLRI